MAVPWWLGVLMLEQAELRMVVQRHWSLAGRVKSGDGVKGWQMKLAP